MTDKPQPGVPDKGALVLAEMLNTKIGKALSGTGHAVLLGVRDADEIRSLLLRNHRDFRIEGARAVEAFLLAEVGEDEKTEDGWVESIVDARWPDDRPEAEDAR